MSRAIARILFVAPLVLAACDASGPGRAAARWSGSMDTLPGGGVHVANPATGVWREGEGWRIEEDLRLGRNEEGPELFSQVGAVGLAPNGDILVADGATQEVRVFDAAGRFRRAFGRKGQGPGEFLRITGLQFDPRGRLWVADLGNARYELYDTAYARIGEATVRLPPFILPWMGGFDAQGRVYDAMTARDATGLTSFIFIRTALDASAWADTLPPLSYQAAGARPAPRRLILALPRMVVRFDPRGYLWSAVTGDYRVVQRTWEGDTVRIIERAFTAPPISAAERDSIVQDLREWPPNLPPTYTPKEIPAAKPAIDRLYVDDEGHLIVQTRGTPDEEGRAFDVFDAEGRYLGRVLSPIRFSTIPVLPIFAHGLLYGVTTDSLGAEQVVRARLRT